MTDMNNTKNQSSGGIADDANVYDIEEDRRSIDSFYNTDNDEAMCLAAAQIAGLPSTNINFPLNYDNLKRNLRRKKRKKKRERQRKRGQLQKWK
jgi:hypothetical protein